MKQTLKQKIAGMQRAWNSLSLAVIQKAELTPGQWAAIATVEPYATDDFVKVTPLKIGELASDFQSELIQCAREVASHIKSNCKRTFLPFRQDRDEEKDWVKYNYLHDKLFADLQKINQIFFRGHELGKIGLEIGYYKESRVNFVHTDNVKNEIAYLARVGAFPFSAMDGTINFSTDPKIQNLIKATSEMKDFDPQYLRLLKPIPLSDIVLIACDYGPLGKRKCGTLHASGSVSRPDYSAFIRYGSFAPRLHS